MTESKIPKFKVGDVVEYKYTNEGFCGVADDGDWMVIRLPARDFGDVFGYAVYHPDNTGDYYPEYTLTKVPIRWQDLPVKERHVEYNDSHKRFLCDFQVRFLNEDPNLHV